MKRALKVIGIVVAVIVVMVVLISIGYDDAVANRGRMGATSCLRETRDFLTAQSVPTAQYVPCFTDSAGGWTLTHEGYSNDGAQFEMTTDKVQGVDWSITFGPECQPATDKKVDKPNNPATVYRQTVDVPEVDGIRRTEWMVFEGGCVVSAVTVPGRVDRALILGEVDRLLTLVSRSVLNADVHAQTDGKLTLDPAPAGGATSTTVPPASTSSAPGSTRRGATTTRAPDDADNPPTETGPDQVDPNGVDPNEFDPGANDPGSGEPSGSESGS